MEKYASIPQFVMIYFNMQRFKFIDFMVIELRFFKKKKMMNTDKMGESDIMHVLHHKQQNFVCWLFFTHSLH